MTLNEAIKQARQQHRIFFVMVARIYKKEVGKAKHKILLSWLD